MTENSQNPKYNVGYGHPPKHTQFKPGQSGNPKGRPKGARSASSIATEILNQKLTLKNGHKITCREALIHRLRENALKGDRHALDRLLALDANAQIENAAPETTLTPNEIKTLEGLTAAFANSPKKNDKENS